MFCLRFFNKQQKCLRNQASKIEKRNQYSILQRKSTNICNGGRLFIIRHFQAKKQPNRHFLMVIEIEQFQQSRSLYLNSKAVEPMMPSYFSFPNISQHYYFVPSPSPEDNYILTTPYFIITNPVNTQSLPTTSLDISTANSLPDIPSQNAQHQRLDQNKPRKKRQSNPQRERISAKKNSQSNIINHYFNYFTNRQCSQHTLRRIALSLKRPSEQLENIMACFNSAVRLINLKRGRAYINKSTLLSFFSEEEILLAFPQFVKKLNSSKICTVSELSSLLRRSFYIFVREICFTSILTSKRISMLSKEAHIEKRRKILKYLNRKDNLE